MTRPISSILNAATYSRYSVCQKSNTNLFSGTDASSQSNRMLNGTFNAASHFPPDIIKAMQKVQGSFYEFFPRQTSIDAEPFNTKFTRAFKNYLNDIEVNYSLMNLFKSNIKNKG